MPNWVQVTREAGSSAIWYIDSERVNHSEESSVFWVKEGHQQPVSFYGKATNVKYVIHHAMIDYKSGTFSFGLSFYYDSQGQLLYEEQKSNPIHFIIRGTVFYEFFKVVSQYKKGASGCLVWIIAGFSVGLLLTFGFTLLA